MENFDVSFEITDSSADDLEKSNHLEEEIDNVNLLVSPPCEKDGKIYAFVSVDWEGKTAEFKIPSCELVANKGFSESQIETLKDYIQENVPMLKKEAAGINVLENMFGSLGGK